MDSYIEKCEKAREIQKLWKPKVGDYVWRKHNFFGEKIDKQIWSKDKREEIIILTYASDVDGYFHATKDGETRIFKSHNEAHKKTCIWLPTQKQLQEMIKEKYYKLTIEHYDTSRGALKSKISFSDAYYKPLIRFSECDYKVMWLRIIMKYKYNKIWNGKDWIKRK